MGLVGGDNNIFDMKERQVFSNIWVFKDLECFCSNLYQRLHTLLPFGKSI
jgi:hypothetical protein